MAPASNPGFDYQPLIHRNCYVFLGPDADIDVVSRKDSFGRLHVHVLKTEDNKRTALLSATSDNNDLQQALELLHDKSARAVDQYVLVNGFALPPNITTHSGGEDGRRPADDPENALEHSEVIALCGSSSEEDASDSDDSLVDFPRRMRRVALKAVNVRRSRSDDAGETTGPMLVNSRLPHRRPGSLGCPPVAGLAYPPPPPGPLPPPGWYGRINARPPPPPVGGAPPPLPPRMPIKPPQKPTLTPVRLNITWLGHGEKKLLVQCTPTEQTLCQRALMEVRLRALQFPNLAPEDASPARLCNLRALLLRVRLGEEAYELSSFGDDLSKLCGGAAGVIPAFDVEVKPWKSTRGLPSDEVDSDVETIH
ncbi:Fc.00g076860.m01.CDS01 [Cosmosporella sp. VM-42]